MSKISRNFQRSCSKAPRTLETGLRRLICGLVVAISLTALGSAAEAYTSEQRIACTPDAFRLCSSEIPNIEGITACMRKQKSSLSSACKAVFDK